jgi:hypothetical protein
VLIPRTSTGPSIHIVAVPTLAAFATRTSYVSFSPTEKGSVAFPKGARLLAQTPMTVRAINPGRPSWMAQRARRGKLVPGASRRKRGIILQDAGTLCD